MLKVEHIEVWGWEHAIRGMRNPKNSWDRIDSGYGKYINPDNEIGLHNQDTFHVGPNDLDLMKRLYKGGTEHRKFMRQIFISMDITAPLYWWKEFDTYKVGTVANSCSTMHKISSKEFELDDFSHEHLLCKEPIPCETISSLDMLQFTIRALEGNRKMFLKTDDKRYWWQLIQLLPSSYNQKRTVTFSYENAVTIIKHRSGHKLDEWKILVDLLKQLPNLSSIMET